MGNLVKWSEVNGALAKRVTVEQLPHVKAALKIADAAIEELKAQKDYASMREVAVQRVMLVWRAGQTVKNVQAPPGAVGRGQKVSERGYLSPSDMGVSEQDAWRWKMVAQIPETVLLEHLSGAKEPPRLNPYISMGCGYSERTTPKQDVPEGKFSVIYADPPWSYTDKSTSGGHWAGAENHYGTLSIDDICAFQIQNRPVVDWAADDALLFLWVTFPLLYEALPVFEAWGFQYKTCAFTWVKTDANGGTYMGLGNYTRGNAELCLLGRRGKGIRRQSAAIKQVIMAPRLDHSRKPAAAREGIDALVGDVAKLELFGREQMPGWTVVGNQVQRSLLGGTVVDGA